MVGAGQVAEVEPPQHGRARCFKYTRRDGGEGFVQVGGPHTAARNVVTVGSALHRRERRAEREQCGRLWCGVRRGHRRLRRGGCGDEERTVLAWRAACPGGLHQVSGPHVLRLCCGPRETQSGSDGHASQRPHAAGAFGAGAEWGRAVPVERVGSQPQGLDRPSRTAGTSVTSLGPMPPQRRIHGA